MGYIIVIPELENVYQQNLKSWLVNIGTILDNFRIRQILKQTVLTLENLYNKDTLTGLYNRHYMMERLKEAYEGDKPCGIAMIDIDNFKSINDRYGHSAGDEVLRKVAQTIEETCTDCIASRWGGEEFLILTGENSELIEQLRKAVENLTVEFEEKVIKVTLTAGFEPKNKELTLDKWIVSADEKLYRGKNSGKNRVVT